MYKPSIDDMFSGKESRYALVIGIAKRAREISEEFENNNVVTTNKPVLLAIKEFENHKYNILEPEINDWLFYCKGCNRKQYIQLW